MKRFRWLALFLLPIALLLSGSNDAYARSSDLNDPDPIAIPAGKSAEDVSRAIKSALAGRTWVVSSEQPGRINATLNLRSHVARIAITYDATSIRIAYVSSENLKYKEKNGKRSIHSNYISWIGNLVTDISRQLQSG